ncbi:hypothetical protein B0H21DRAFT_360452 [Amylocystis lapponica]|nr:hypothetical protein B0H21DRAFT_360452 [Amylocystis lapponica]
MSTSLPITMTSTPQPAQSAQPAVAATTAVLDLPFLKYPPFPVPPAGATITPFSKFKPAGIQMNLDPVQDDIELDGLGIPTVVLPVRHDLTEAERRKRKKKVAAPDGTVRLPPWFEDWALAEHLRRTSAPIDPSQSRVDRFHQASQDFKASRAWPGVGSGVPQLWDAFRLYVGIISSVHPPPSRKRMQMMREAEQEAEDDSDDDADADADADAGPREQPVVVVDDEKTVPPTGAPRPAPHHKPDDETDEARELRREHFREAKDLRMDAFFDDTEKDIKVFFSSYYRDKGLIWSEQRTRDGPILIGFFLNFLLRNRVLPEHEKGLQRALLVVEQARKELPATFVVGKALPDDFSDGCRELFGNMTQALMWPNDDDNDAAAAAVAPEEPDAKRRKVDEAEAEEKQDVKVETETETERVLNDAAGEAGIEVLSPDVVMDMEQAAADPIDEWSAPSGGTWGDSWGDADAVNTWMAEPESHPLMRLLGLTALPFTHTTGVVEKSTRRIVSVTAATQAKSGKKKKGRGVAELVEEELGARLARMVLAPWATFDENEHSDVNRPLILPDSRGAVVMDGIPDVSATRETGAASTLPAHTPLKDEITVLVDPAVADKLIVGMGLGATWVQIVRQASTDPSEASTEKKKRGGYGEAGEPTKFWYMEHLVATLPGFHTEQ